MTILLTGAAGFIGFHVAKALLEKGETVIGVDSLNHYYDVSLKHARLAQLARYRKTRQLTFYPVNIADRGTMQHIAESHKDITHIIHLAAQAGVRYSLTHPMAYAESNLTGQLVMLEVARSLKKLKHFVYASSSSVYGNSADLPLKTSQDVRTPISLYAATKASGELMAHSYSHLYGIPATGLRFFTVYGPWGRPDMAYYLFARGITEGTPITMFGGGKMRRDFTYIDDIVSGTLGALKTPPKAKKNAAPHRVLNLGNNRSEKLPDLIKLLEKNLGKKAVIKHAPMQDGDVKDTHADISESTRLFGYKPTTKLADGIPQFVEWFKRYHKV